MNDIIALREAEKLLEKVKHRPRRFGTYPEYRDSDTKSLAQIPKHWSERRLKYIGTIKYGLGEPPRRTATGLPFIRATDIERGKINLDGVQRVDSDGVPWGRDPSLKAKDILVVRSGAYTGDSAIVPAVLEEQRAIAGYDMVLRVTHAMPEFVAYSFLSKYVLQGQIFLAKMRAAQPHLNAADLGGFHVVLPPLDEQRVIARFLDRETAKIDSLVEKKRRLIELLDEKRTALISHAVTKGLNPDVPMKPSGIDWLGEVPAHWQFRKLGFLASMRGGMTPSKGNDAYWRGVIPWVSPKDMKFREITDTEDHISESALEETTLRLFQPPVVLMVVRGMILAHTFPVAITKVPVTINQDMKALMPYKGCSEEYLLNLLRGLSRVILGTVDDSAHGTKVLRLPVWKHVGVFVPDATEQMQICDHINDVSARFDRLIKKVESASDRLNEYRSSLISAAVTGQIDVRKEVE